MRINTNMMALNAQNKLTGNQTSVSKSIAKLSSGLRINSAADDASGLAISEKMRAQIRGLSQAQSNAQDGISMLQTAEGALQQTTDILQRMRELVIKAQNTGVLTDEDRTSINTELSTLMNRNTFRKKFTNAFGVSPVQYRIRHRITIAKKFLAAGLPVGEIAISLGYPDIYSFTHQFTAVTGQSPTEFREIC